VAAKLRRELNTEVDMVHGHYAEFKVLVDGEVVVQGGPLTFLGVMPSGQEVVEKVKARLSAPASP
jgi:hypothetical protein